MEKYVRKISFGILSLALGLGLMLLSSELLASPDTTVYWLGVALTLLIAFLSGAFALGKLYSWLKWSIDTNEHKESI